MTSRMLIMIVAKTRHNVLTPMMTGFRESGSKRLDSTPGGGCRAGVVARYILSIERIRRDINEGRSLRFQSHQVEMRTIEGVDSSDGSKLQTVWWVGDHDFAFGVQGRLRSDVSGNTKA